MALAGGAATGMNVGGGARPAAPAGAALLSGWGLTTTSAAAAVALASNTAALAEFATLAVPRGRIARGAGRSYGDAALNGGGLVVDCRPLGTIHALDEHAQTVTVDAGISMEGLLRVLVPRGWFPAVMPGTRFVTVGGAIANDVHGKNHHRDGTFGANVVQLELVTADGCQHTLAPDREPELFWATVGGLGLTGFIATATLRIAPIETASFDVQQLRFPDLDALLSAMQAGDDRYQYSVAWLDLATRGRGAGRGILMSGNHRRSAEARGGTTQRPDAPPAYQPRRTLPAGVRLPALAFGRLSMRLLNSAWYYHPAAERATVGVDGFLFPLDVLRDWNRWYGQAGFVQYQCVLPRGREDTLHELVQRLASGPVPVTLAMLKRMGAANPAPLSFPLEGWTLAADMPAGDGRLAPFLRSLDVLVAGAGGRVYLAKDGRMQPDVFAEMYPRLSEWRAVRHQVDPDRHFTSDLARRLGL